MAALAAHLDVEKVGRRHARTGTHRHVAARRLGCQMQSINLLDARVFQHAGLDHGPGAAKHFLRGLEEKHRSSRHLGAPCRQQFRQGNADGDVPVVAAGVHHPRCAGGEGGVEDFGQRQGVDVGAPGDGASRLVALQNANDGCGAAHAGAHVQTCGLQAFGDNLRRAMFLKTEFGMAMEVTPQGDEVLVAGRQFFGPGEGRLAQGNSFPLPARPHGAQGIAGGA